MLKKVCNYPACRELVGYDELYCDKHKKLIEEQRAERKPSRAPRKHYNNDSFYHSTAWKRLRKRHILAEPFCRRCREKGIFRPANIVDHITELEDGGEPLDDANLQSLCYACHNRKTKEEKLRRMRSCR